MGLEAPKDSWYMKPIEALETGFRSIRECHLNKE